ncbi:adenylate cyclase type 2 [Hetaerina americana]|uniref:adenylate cyclase type 2 n=1 Tax=Hetaerina americana TaxID=62018 RepID=UPI003A7F1C3C
MSRGSLNLAAASEPRLSRERRIEMEPAGGMELLTLNSINSQKNPSQVSLYMRDASSSEMDEDSWSWTYLREQFRIKDLEGLYLRYQRRLQHAYFSIFLMLQFVLGLTHLLVLYFASNVDLTMPDMVAYGFLSLICVPIIVITYSEKILNTWPWMQLVLSFLVIFVLLAVDVGLPLYHSVTGSDGRTTPSNSSDGGSWTTLSLESVLEFEVEKPRLAEIESMSSAMSAPTNSSDLYLANDSKQDYLVVRPVYAAYSLLACYVFLPLPDNRQAFVMGIITTVFHLVCNGVVSYQDYTDNIRRIVADAIYFVCVNILGLYLRYVDEVMIRRTFLDRRACIKCTNMLKYEKDQEEQLMLSILPSHIASQVKEDIRKIFQHIKEHHTAPIRKKPFSDLYVERHENVSILYADVVNFTQLTVSLTVNKLVETLNELFGSFDEASKDRNVLRIKFLGDCYYCVAGIPQPKPNPDHAKSCVELGLDMIAIIKDVREERGVNVDMRIGVHTGRILSGLLGLCKWQYDIWSLDVEIANHMEMAGKPGKVHVTKQTLSKLDNAYQYEIGGGAVNDPFLAKHNIETFLISPKDKQEEGRRRAYSRTLPNRRTSEGVAKLSSKSVEYYKAKRGLSTSEGMTPPRRRMVFMDDNVLLYREMQKRANNHMAEAIEKMPLGKYDQWFQGEQIHPLFLTFEDSRWEIPFLQQPDPLFKFYATCAAPLIIGMLLVQGIALPRWPNGIFWLCFSLASFVVLLFIVLPLFWAQVIWSTWQDPREEFEEPVPPPTHPFLSWCYDTSSFLVRSTGARIAAYLFIMFCLSISAFSLLVECQGESLKGNSSDGNNMEAMESRNCSPPWQITETVVLAVMMNFLFLKIHYGLKLSVSCILTSVYSWIVWSKMPAFFQNGETSNPTLDPRISHIMYVVFFNLSMHVMDRQMEYMNRLDYKWKRKLFEEQDEASTTRMVNKMLLQNILPIHVAEIYLNTNRATELYCEEYESISVMFASIVPEDKEDEECDTRLNDLDEYSSQPLGEQLSDKDDGYGSLKLLNEFICGFDKLLLEPLFMRVEKIKVTGWTYLAGCGLQPGRRDSNNSGRSNSRSDDIGLGEEISSRITADNIIVLVRFAANMMSVLEGINKDGFQQYKLRIGIQHGPVMAGVVGAHKPLYDIWGDTVNVAARLDSSGELGKIQVTQETALLLMKHGVHCESRGMTYLKGKGHLPTYFVCLDGNFDLIMDRETKTIENTRTQPVTENILPQIVIHRPDQVCSEPYPGEATCGPPRGDSGFADYEHVEELFNNDSECKEDNKNNTIFTKL